jgi:hypothetical protein
MTRLTKQPPLLLLLLLLLLLALALPASCASASLPAHSKSKKGGGATCPNAQRCNLVSQSDYDELLSRLEVVERLVGTVAVSLVRGQAWIGGPDECEAGQGTARRRRALQGEGSGGDGFKATCIQQSTGNPPSVYLNLHCPSGYNAAVEADCRGDAYTADGDKIRSLPLIWSGTFSRQAHCEVSTEGLPEGTRVDVIARIKCGAYYELDDPKNSHVNRGAGGGAGGDGGTTKAYEQEVVRKGGRYTNNNNG